MKFDFGILRKAATDLGKQVREHRTEIERLKVQREDVAGAPAHRADIKALFDHLIELRTAEYKTNLANHLTTVRRKTAAFAADDAHLSNFMRVFAVGHGAGAADPRAIDAALLALLGPVVRPALHRLIDEAQPAGEGLPLVERSAKLAELDSKIDALLEEEQSMTAAAREAGLTVE